MAPKYEAEINLDVANAHTRVIGLVGRDKRVLELGCASGYMSRVLTERFGARVTGVELNEEMAAEARQHCAQVITGDLDTIDWSTTLGAERFDVVIAADVLEHTRHPAALLAALRPYLADGGYLVASVPNVAHGSVLVELLNGRFSYQPTGLLDDTHIRFFTRDSLYECLEQAGFTVTYLERVEIPPGETEFRTDLSPFSEEVRALIESRDEVNTYQFILTAHPASPGATRAKAGRRRGDRASPLTIEPVPGAIDAMLDAAVPRPGDGVLQALTARVAFLESGRQHQTELIGALRQQLLRSEVHIGYLDSNIKLRDSKIKQWRDQSARLREEIDRAHQQAAASPVSDDLRRAHDASARRLVAERLHFGDEIARLQRDREQLAAQVREANMLAAQLRHAEALAAQQYATDCQRLDADIAHLKVLIDQYERSRSWRITAPMRAFFRALRRLTRPSA